MKIVTGNDIQEDLFGEKSAIYRIEFSDIFETDEYKKLEKDPNCQTCRNEFFKKLYSQKECDAKLKLIYGEDAKIKRMFDHKRRVTRSSAAPSVDIPNSVKTSNELVDEALEHIKKSGELLEQLKGKKPEKSMPTSDKKEPTEVSNPYTKKRKILLEHYLSPGDVVCMTAAVRDLVKAHGDKFDVGVSTSTMELWEANEYIDKSITKDTPDIERFKIGYTTSINNSNEGSHSLVTGFHIDLEEKLDLRIPPTKHYGDVPISDEEKGWISMIHQHYTNEDTPYWIIFSGGKTDYTAKHWISDYTQEVVDHFKDRIQFVQCGVTQKGHSHPKLDGVIDLRDKTDMRQFIRLMYHAQGVVCSVTLADHLAAAVPVRDDRPKRRACITICGGREPHRYIDYTNHTTFHTNGMLDCCDNGGCWKSRTVPLDDGNRKDKELCINTTEVNGKKVQKCMSMITPDMVINAIEGYMQHSKMNYVEKTIEA